MKYKNVLKVKNKVIIILSGCGFFGTEFGKHLPFEKVKIIF